jgi:uncharacterized protein YjbJ (UPF0337 family)
MANDPRLFTVKPCGIQNQSSANAASRKKGFLDNIMKVGDLELLNDIGFGKVGEGLRVLSFVSDSIRTGESAVPGREGKDTYTTALGRIAGTAVDAVNEGANVVIDTVGLGGVADAVGQLNPQVANRAYGQAKNIFQRVKQGNFKLRDIPEVFQDLQNLETLGRNIFGNSGSGQPTKRRELCGATPYARDLIAYAPKFKFLFIVEIIPAAAYASWSDFTDATAFVVKTSTRPRFDVEYEEVNMYNFRTRVPKRVEYPAITMSFYDDNKNMAHSVYTAYMRAMSPIANIKAQYPQAGEYEKSGMDFARSASSATFNPTTVLTAGHSASLGPLDKNATSIFSEIRLHHIFDYGNRMNTYHFYNPRITSFTPSELSQMETGDGTDFEFEFVYDGLYVDHNVSLQADRPTFLKDTTSRHGQFPIDPVYDEADPSSSNGIPSAAEQEQNAPSTSLVAGVENLVGGVRDMFGNVIGGVQDTFEGLVDGVTGQIGAAIPEDIRAFGTNAYQAAGDALRGARNVVNGITDGATGAVTAVQNASSGLTGAMNQNISAVQKSLGGLGNTISNAFTKVKNFGGSFFS